MAKCRRGETAPKRLVSNPGASEFGTKQLRDLPSLNPGRSPPTLVKLSCHWVGGGAGWKDYGQWVYFSLIVVICLPSWMRASHRGRWRHRTTTTKSTISTYFMGKHTLPLTSLTSLQTNPGPGNNINSLHTLEQWFSNILPCPRWLSGEESACPWRRHRRRWFDPWVRKISWRRAEQATHSSIFAWRFPRTEEHGGQQSMGSIRVEINLATEHAPSQTL